MEQYLLPDVSISIFSASSFKNMSNLCEFKLLTLQHIDLGKYIKEFNFKHIQKFAILHSAIEKSEGHFI